MLSTSFIRQKRGTRDQVKLSLRDLGEIEAIRQLPCRCSQRCVQLFSIGEILDIRMKLEDKDQKQEKEWRDRELTQGSFINLYGRNICRKAWGLIIGGKDYSRTMAYKPRVRDGISDLSPQEKAELKSGLPGRSTKQDAAETWISLFLKSLGENDPESGKLKILSLSISQAHATFMNEIGKSVPDHVSLSTFRNAWRVVCEDLSVSIMTKDARNKCDTCIGLANAISNATQKTRALIEKDCAEHRSLVRKLREMYYIRRARPFYDDKHASLIIDGMDQAKSHIPYSSAEHLTQADIKDTRVIQRIHGVIIHGIGKFIYCVNPNVRKGANQMISILQDAVSYIPSRVTHLSVQVDGASGDLFYHYQLINCSLCRLPIGNVSGPENWNKYLLAFLNEMVLKGRFLDIELHRLPVGHTHEDIDQMFSVISRALKKAGTIRDPLDFIDFLATKIWKDETPVKVVRIFNVLDVEKRYEDIIDEIRGLGHPTPVHMFRFIKRDNTNKVLIRYKMNEASPVWYPRHVVDVASSKWIETEIDGLVDLLKSTPTIIPPMLNPDPFDVRKLRSSCITHWNLTHQRQWNQFWAAWCLQDQCMEWHSCNFMPAEIISSPVESDFAEDEPDVAEMLPEPVVIGSKLGIALWTSDQKRIRDKKRTSNATMAPPEIGQFVLYMGDEYDALADKEVGYDLPFSIGHVIAASTNTRVITVQWMYAENFSSVFIPWVNDFDGQPNTQDLHLSDLMCCDNQLLILTFTANSTLTDQSKELLSGILGAESFVRLS